MVALIICNLDPTMRVVRSDYARLRPMESSGVAMSDMIEPTEDVLTINPGCYKYIIFFISMHRSYGLLNI